MILAAITAILVPAVIIMASGAFCAGCLAVAAKVFYVYEDPRIGEALALMPMANCAGCGYPGCAEYSAGLINDNAAINLCTPGGSDLVEKLGELMGVDAGDNGSGKTIAIVLCGGDAALAPRSFDYNGIADCVAAASVGGGDKGCSHGCLGYGTCARVCPVDAIEMTAEDLAVVHGDICISCGLCVPACPKDIIKMVPESRSIHVLCSSPDKGAQVKKYCSVGCIGCHACTKVVDEEEITMDGMLAVVDYSKELESLAPREECPTNCIVEREAGAAIPAGGVVYDW